MFENNAKKKVIVLYECKNVTSKYMSIKKTTSRNAQTTETSKVKSYFKEDFVESSLTSKELRFSICKNNCIQLVEEFLM